MAGAYASGASACPLTVSGRVHEHDLRETAIESLGLAAPKETA